MSLVGRSWASIVVVFLSGCVLHASQFLPRTGRYVYTVEERPDGGREELFRVLVVTADQGPTRASVQVSRQDAGTATVRDGDGSADPTWPSGEVEARATVVLVSPTSGDLLNDATPPQVLLPEPVVTGARWRANPGNGDACVIEGRVTAVAEDLARVAYDLTCGGATAPLVEVSWQVGRGQVENRSPDGGFVVRFSSE